MISPSTALLIIAAALLPVCASAQVPTEVRKSQTSGVEFFTTNTGIFGLNVGTGDAGLFYPRGSGIAYIYGGGLWFGAKRTVDDTVRPLTLMTYNPNRGTSWMTAGEWTDDPDVTLPFYDQLAYSPDYDRGSGAHTGTRPAWPLWQSPGITSTFSDPGIYIADSASRTPSQSGIPAFVAGVAEQFVSRYHDGDTARYDGLGATIGFPIGIQIEQNVFGFSRTEDKATVILHYRLINVSGDTLRDCYISNMFDPDIGRDASNDGASVYIARPDLETAYAWSAGESPWPGTVVFTMLESPAIETSQSSPSYRFVRHDKRHYDASEQLGLATFQNWTIVEDPRQPRDIYAFQASEELDGHPGAGDRRILLSSGPFNLAPGDTARLAVGLTVLPEHHVTTVGAQSPVEEAAERMIELYRSEPVSSVEARSTLSDAMSIEAIHPNPTAGMTSIQIRLPRPSDVRLQLVDALGRIVLERESGVREAGDHRLNLDLSGVEPGVYVISVEAAGERQSRSVVVSR